MTDGTISNCEANCGGGVSVPDNVFIMTGGSITECEATNGGGVGINGYEGEFHLSSTGTVTHCSADYGGGVYIQEDVEHSLIISNGGSITECEATKGGGVYLDAIRGYATLAAGGVISNCTAVEEGGGVYVECQNGSHSLDNIFEMTGGAITECEATNGGGIYVSAKGLAVMSGGSITECEATGKGGGVYVDSDDDNENVFGVFAMTGGNITDCSANTKGGGVYLTTYTNLTVSGEVVVEDNTHGTAKAVVVDNVYLDDATNKYVTIDATGLACGSHIGVTKTADRTDSNGMAFTEIARGSATNCRNAFRNGYFFDDRSQYGVYNLSYDTYTNDKLYFIDSWEGKAPTAVAGTDYVLSGDYVSTVNTALGLAYLAKDVNGGKNYSGKTVTLSNNIDLVGSYWVPIGQSNMSSCSGSSATPFAGTFNGQGKAISNVESILPYQDMGLFGLTEQATITNTFIESGTLVSTYVPSSDDECVCIGGLVGEMKAGAITYSEATVTMTESDVNKCAMGGLVGKADKFNNGGSDKTFLIHSCMAMPEISAISNDGRRRFIGGLVGDMDNGTVANCYANAKFTLGTNVLILVGGMGGRGGESLTIDNCYVRLQTAKPNMPYQFGWLLGSGDSSVATNCYIPSDNSDYYGNTTSIPSGCGTYGVVKDRKEIGYMYYENLVVANTNTYVGGEGVTSYIGNHIPVWNGLLSALNQWVSANPHNFDPAPTKWFRPTTQNINGDLPILGFSTNNSVAALDADPNTLTYGSLDALLTANNGKTASIFLYGNATNVVNTPSTNVKVFVNEDACLLQSGSGDFINTTVGITFDNSGKDNHNVSEYGDELTYDWHMMSTPLSDAPINTTYDAQSLLWGPVNITGMDANCYFPNGLPMGSGYDSGVKWDFYTYYEPQYHWINLKRGSDSHWHMDNGQQIIYTNEKSFVPGKGYMMAISQDSYMSSTGTLNKGNVEITLTNQEPSIPGFPNGYNKGWNLVGNPYQAYLDLNRVGVGTYYIYDAESGMYTPYVSTGSENPVTPSRYIHPHQAFFMYTATDNNKFTFTSSMATTMKEDGSYFRDDEQINYPLVDLFVSNEAGYNDLAIIEFNRPEIGGATKVNLMGNANFKLAAAYGGQTYGLLFAPEDAERIPVHFTTNEDGEYTLRWETYNGLFTSLHLVDNLTGVNYDMLANDHYDFTASADDYASRFYITYKCVGIDENGTSTGSFAYFDGSEWVIEGKGQLDVVDVLGRVLYSERLYNEQNHVNLNGFAPGVYLMRLTEGTETRVQKIVNK